MRNRPKKTLNRVCSFLLPTQKLILFVFINCCLCSFPLTGQIDSLEQRLTTLPEDTQKVDILNQLSYRYHRKDVQQTFAYANKALALATKLNYGKGIGFANHYLSMGNALSGNTDLSKTLNIKTLKIADSLQIFDLMMNAYNMQAFNFNKDGQHVESMKAFQKSLDLALKTGDKVGYSGVALNLGEINANKKNYEKARTYFHQALEVAHETKETAKIAWAYRMIGDTYAEEKKFTEASPYLEKAVEGALKAKDHRSLAYTKLRLGKVHMELNKIELAEMEILASIDLIQKVGDKEGEMDGYVSLMKVYLRNKQFNKVIQVGQKATELATQYKSVELQLEMQDLLSQGYANTQNFQKAFQLNLSSQVIKDSLDITNKLNLATELEEKYQSKKKATENALLRAEKEHQINTIEQQKAINISLGFVALLLALLGYAAFKAYQNKHRNNVILEKKVAERTQALQLSNTQLLQSNKELARFAYVASHDLREPLRNITNFTTLLQEQFKGKSNEDALVYMDIIHKNTAHMNQLIVDTLEFTRLNAVEKAKTAVDLNQTINNIKSSIASTLSQKQVVIELEKPLPIVQANDSLLFSVFKNLIENSINYNESERPTIKINHTIKGEAHLFSIADNGIGIPKEYQETVFEMFKRLQNREKYQGTGMGLSNCKKIINKLGGKIWVESDGQNGSTFFFTLPVISDNQPTQKVYEKKANLEATV